MKGDVPGSALSTAIGDYLKAIWIVGQGDRATTSALAEHLSVSAPSVSGMLARLQAQGWVTYERYKGATLTERGAAEALRLLRRHRLIETFLIEYLSYTWDEVHEEAESIEHAISDRFTERLAERLGHSPTIPTEIRSPPDAAGCRGRRTWPSTNWRSATTCGSRACARRTPRCSRTSTPSGSAPARW